MDTVPQVEAEFARLNRDYTVNKTQYTALVERLEKARLGEEAEEKGSVRFEIIDPPSADFHPVSPKRTLLLLAALFAAVAGGIGVAYLLAALHPVFHTARQLGEFTGATILGAVSATQGPEKVSRVRRQYVFYSMACGALFVALVVVVIVGRTMSPLGFGPHH